MQMEPIAIMVRLKSAMIAAAKFRSEGDMECKSQQQFVSIEAKWTSMTLCNRKSPRKMAGGVKCEKCQT